MKFGRPHRANRPASGRGATNLTAPPAVWDCGCRGGGRPLRGDDPRHPTASRPRQIRRRPVRGGGWPNSSPPHGPDGYGWGCRTPSRFRRMSLGGWLSPRALDRVFWKGGGVGLRQRMSRATSGAQLSRWPVWAGQPLRLAYPDPPTVGASARGGGVAHAPPTTAVAGRAGGARQNSVGVPHSRRPSVKNSLVKANETPPCPPHSAVSGRAPCRVREVPRERLNPQRTKAQRICHGRRAGLPMRRGGSCGTCGPGVKSAWPRRACSAPWTPRPLWSVW